MNSFDKSRIVEALCQLKPPVDDLLQLKSGVTKYSCKLNI